VRTQLTITRGLQGLLLTVKGFEMKFAASLVVSLAFSLNAAADDHAGMNMNMEAEHPSAAMSSGEVRKVDKDTGKITIKHGPLVNLGMPAMTMVFHVADAAMLDQVKPGDRIAFVAEKKNGALTVVKMEAPQ
jgi:Cu(I)/Ag(I) efflux system periplasmic protein CusF